MCNIDLKTVDQFDHISFMVKQLMMYLYLLMPLVFYKFSLKFVIIEQESSNNQVLLYL